MSLQSTQETGIHLHHSTKKKKKKDLLEHRLPKVFKPTGFKQVLT